MLNLVLIFVGGGAGSVARYLVIEAGMRVHDDFPLGTIVVNVLGCLLIGILGYFVVEQASMKEAHRLVLIVGFLGGFTTFSTFGFETLMLFQEGQHVRAVLNVILSNLLGLTAVWLGYVAAGRLLSGESV